MKLLDTLLFLILPALTRASDGGDEMTTDRICTSENNMFTVHVNLFASELGYYTFEECGDMTNPTIGIEVGETYTFVQAHRSNYFHPMGFAYFPDGAHDDVDELEPGIAQGSDDSCASDMTCPAPMYFLNEEYLGSYSNIPDVTTTTGEVLTTTTTGEDNFGLDDYEPLFFYPMAEWASLGEFTIQLNFNDESYSNDIFYFCHIHQFMSGRIKLLNNGEPIQPEEEPPLGYEYDVPSEFDETCGTFGLDEFQLPHANCPREFVCDADEETKPFADCIDAMNCHMFAGMTTYDSSQSDKALFIHQMIPHHQNAVNMAKALLHTPGEMDCADITNEDDPECALEVILREIINGQNFQIQALRGVLEAEGWPATDNCDVIVNPDVETSNATEPSGENATETTPDSSAPSFFTSAIVLVGAIAISSLVQ